MPDLPSLMSPMPPTRASEHFSDSSDEDIEMANLDDIAMTPGLPKSNGYSGLKHSRTSDSGSEDEHDDDDAGEHGALLSPATERARMRTVAPLPVRKQVLRLVIETGPTLLLTTVSLLFTGELLDHVSRWRAMSAINELIILIPVILNLKGNLEMNLSARLGTAANVGELDEPSSRNPIIWGNLSLLQVQAALVSFVAANVSFVLAHFMPQTHVEQVDPFPEFPEPNADTSTNATAIATRMLRLALSPRVPPTAHRPHPTGPIVPKFSFAEYIMVSATAMAAACLSSALLGSFMCALVLLCRKAGLDPDNIAPPLAACLGDLVTLTLVGAVSSALIDWIKTPGPLVLALLIVGLGVGAAVLVRRNNYVRPLLTQGWPPLFGAMVISSATGIVLDVFVSRYRGFALLAIVISGLPGSAGSIFVSRQSTALHAAARPTRRDAGSMPSPPPPSARLVMLTLIAVAFPIELFFLGLVRALGWVKLPFVFMAFSVLFFCLAVTTSLILARALTDLLWRWKLDPDMYAMPVHSALMDLVGQLLLVGCFEIVQHLGKDVKAS